MQIDDEVRITGPPITMDCDDFLGKEFIIDTIAKRQGSIVFSAARFPSWYPESSLELVAKPRKFEIGQPKIL